MYIVAILAHIFYAFNWKTNFHLSYHNINLLEKSKNFPNKPSTKKAMVTFKQKAPQHQQHNNQHSNTLSSSSGSSASPNSAAANGNAAATATSAAPPSVEQQQPPPPGVLEQVAEQSVRMAVEPEQGGILYVYRFSSS
jgi:hypothetical protein